MRKNRLAILIVGPTTVGKTDVAYSLAKAMGGEVINGDAYEMYQEFSLCNGTSDALQYSTVKKYLYQVLAPMEEVPTPADYAVRASACIAEVVSRNKFAIVELYQMRYLSALKNAYQENIIVGLEWRYPENIQEKVRKRWEKVWGSDLINEVRMGLKKGYRKSFVLDKSLVAPYIIRYLDGKISLEDAKKGIIAENVELVHRDLARLREVPGINWIQHDPSKMSETLIAIEKLT